MINLPLYLALRYLRFNKKDKNISLMIKVCFVGIFIGTFSLMLTLIIANGYEKTIHEKIQNINPQITILSPGNKLDLNTVKSALNTKFNNIQAISGNSTKQIILERNGKQTLVAIKGINPVDEEKVTNLKTKVTFPQNTPLSSLVQGNKIIIGHKLASEWGINIGDTVKVLIPTGGTKSKIYLNKEKVIVAGIFNIGLDEYDSNFAFASLPFLNNVFDEEGVDEVALKLNFKDSILNKFTTSSEDKFVTKLKNFLPQLNIYSWKDLYPALVSSLKLEKYVMFIIIALITLVASLNMVSLLFIQIQQKKRDIAIFKAMGMASSDIRHIFLIMGLIITLVSSLLGLTFAGILGFILEKYPFIQLPDVYYVSHLPAKMEPELFLIVFVVTILLGCLATWIPAKRASKINVAEVLRME